ncbi:MAG: hypothetical protein L3K19_06190 [Thermoplasmata archaeon]|nr:hypothetical protein [Thermoplasmata archaeon]
MLLDANAFLPPLGGPRLAEEIDRCLPGAVVRVPASVLRELEALVRRGLPAAPLALALARQLTTQPNAGSGDETIVGLAVARSASVVTADRELRSRLLSRGVSVLVPRDRTRLVLQRPPSPRRVSATVKTPPPVNVRPRGRRKR